MEKCGFNPARGAKPTQFFIYKGRGERLSLDNITVEYIKSIIRVDSNDIEDASGAYSISHLFHSIEPDKKGF